MSDTELGGTKEGVPPAEAFSVIANETRITILQELWRSPDRPITFSDLRRRVEMRDSAQFNYHLRQLTDHFIEQTDEGYDFQHAGKKVVRAILAGTFNEQPKLEPFGIDADCSSCGAPLEASYASGQITISCTDCESLHGRYPFPPGGLNDRTREEVLQAFNQRVRHLHCLAADGVCPECNGRMQTVITPDDEDVLGLDIRVDHRCAQCQHRMHSAVGLSLLDQSDVVSFYRDHDVDLCAEPYWKLDWCVTDDHTTVLSEEPWRIRTDIAVGDEELRVTVDGNLNVLDVERRTADALHDAKTVA